MKASELVKLLVEHIAEEGDQDVYLSPEGAGEVTPVQGVSGYLVFYIRDWKE